MTTNSTEPARAAAPKIECEKEIRFAVVMYGGVSLAIYINGVAQELLHLVRATAKQQPAPNASLAEARHVEGLTHTERVYRKVAYLLADSAMREGDVAAKLDDLEASLDRHDPICTQFVIDILSGTSAGGINAIFLAKALAKDQSMRQLQSLWVSEGDIGKLIQDSRSVETPFTLKQPPASLLNSQRMYVKLLEALDGMESEEREPGAGPPPLQCAKELDLFITATDIRGTPLPICLADRPVVERRHKNVFHFRYATGEINGDVCDDFITGNNPFLAYSARCTSAFPFAFEPMSLNDIDAVLSSSRFMKYQRLDGWQKFFDDYQGSRTVTYEQRCFGDGGYLDNKPFTYAIDTLQHRPANVPVQRKLLYIEPSPEHPEQEVTPQDKPNVFENSAAALLTLPRYETIREDLQRVLERNRLIERVHSILDAFERATERATAWVAGAAPASGPSSRPEKLDKKRQFWKRERLTDAEWAKLDFAQMIACRDPGYVAYHCLEISVVTDELAKLIATVAQFDEDSDYLLAIRSLVRAWRERAYTDYHIEGDQRPTMNQFLLDFDLNYKFRRLDFVRCQVDELFACQDRAKTILTFLGISPSLTEASAGDQRNAFRVELNRIRRVLNKAYATLAEARKRLRSQNPDNPIARRIKDVGITPDVLGWILGEQLRAPAGIPASALLSTNGMPAEQASNVRAKLFLDNNPLAYDNLAAIGVELAGALHTYTDPADTFCLDAVNADGNNTLPTEAERLGVDAARECVCYYYQLYDVYDEMIFPIIYSTGVGETSPVQVYRVSPEDATCLINENDIDKDKPNSKCKKLAGVTLGHFGAFLEQRWRENDILWGRLDGAERIIRALLPDNPNQARRLIGEAQAAIICDAIDRENGARQYIYTLLSESMMRTASGRPECSALAQFIKNLKANANHPALTRKLDDLIKEGDLSDHYRKIFDDHRQLTPQIAMQSAARATTVVGRILQGIADQRNGQGKQAAVWLTRAGQIFWGLVEVAVPRSLNSIIFRYWLKLLYLMEVLLIVGGALGLGEGARDLGWKALGGTLIIHLIVISLTDIMGGRIKRWIIARNVLIATIVGLTLLGVIELREHLIPRLTAWISDGKVGQKMLGYWQAEPLLTTAISLVLGGLLLVALIRLIRRGVEYVRCLISRPGNRKRQVAQQPERAQASP